MDGRDRETRPRIGPLQFLQQVRQEVGKVTWPSRRETLITTAMVFVMVILSSIFFFVVDQAIGFVMRLLFSIGS